jgi:hypothetical protein
MTQADPSHTTYWPSIVAFGEKVPVAPVKPSFPANAKETVQISPIVSDPLPNTEVTGTMYVVANDPVSTGSLIEKSINVFCVPLILILNLPFIGFVLNDNAANQLLASPPV